MRQFRARGRARVVGDIEAALLEYVRDCFAPGITASSKLLESGMMDSFAAVQLVGTLISSLHTIQSTADKYHM
jgi:hypothetical protein